MAGASIPGASPQQQVSFRSAFTLRDSVDLDMWVRYVDTLPTAGFPNPSLTQGIPSYVTLDTRISWRPISSLEFSIVGQNLLDSRHPEFLQELYAPKMTEIPRSVYFQINAKF
jgi:iron complex outermembrane receptor protein